MNSPARHTTLAPAERDDDFLTVTLWAAQAVVGFAFVFFGLFKLTGPLDDLITISRSPT